MFRTKYSWSFRMAILLPVVAILAGGLIYVFLRPSEPLFLEWTRAAGLGSLVDLLRTRQPAEGAGLPFWVIYSLPGALWAFAYSSVITGMWARSGHPVKYLWLSTIPLLVMGIEILQVPGIVPGTFSFQDLWAGILGAGTGAVITLFFLKPSTHESNIR